MFFDTHTHTYFPQFNNQEEVLERMHDAHVVGGIQIGCSEMDSHRAIALVQAYPLHYRATIGIHPSEVAHMSPDDLDQFLDMTYTAYTESIVGIGEIGLDYAFLEGDIATQKQVQSVFFEKQLDFARQKCLPVIIHCRDAFDDMYNILRSHTLDTPIIIHCFSGGSEEVVRLRDLGKDIYFGLSGMITYKKNEYIRHAIRQMPIEKILLETDAPFLAPQAVRGNTNESSYIPYIFDTLCTCRDESMQQLEDQIFTNSMRVFGIGFDIESCSIT